VKLIIQPGDGVKPLIEGIERARKSVEIAIFRFDRKEVEIALENAVRRGVFVHALIADTNRNGEKNLRKLEMRLLAKGMTVARTSDDLVRYHGKVMIIDRKELYVLAFNFTHLDIDHSRSFGIITRNQSLVEEAVQLFESDAKRQPYTPKNNRFIVSPLNARERLAEFLSGAKQELLIYDSKISDRAMIRVLEGRVRAGVSVRIIGRVSGAIRDLEAHKLATMRLHTRTIVRDRKQVFIGSQSLRELELDARREVGVIIPDVKIVAKAIQTFEEDWETSAVSSAEPHEAQGAKAVSLAATKAAEAVAQDLDNIAPVVEQVLQEVVGETAKVEIDSEGLEACVREAVKSAVSETVRDFVEVGQCDDSQRE
jgi:phosphatidylserine/phosphatidylglycerophosphate/cardiolipin synthase-like enzyme